MKAIRYCAAAVALGAMGVAQGAEFNGGGYVACLSESLLDEVITAANQQDHRALEYLLNNGCVQPRAGIPVSVLDSTWTGVVRVRAYLGDDAFVLWTVREAITE
jgi:hypothetical protein